MAYGESWVKGVYMLIIFLIHRKLTDRMMELLFKYYRALKYRMEGKEIGFGICFQSSWLKKVRKEKEWNKRLRN